MRRYVTAKLRPADVLDQSYLLPTGTRRQQFVEEGFEEGALLLIYLRGPINDECNRFDSASFHLRWNQESAIPGHVEYRGGIR